MTEPTDEELRIQARDCPFIRAALASGDEKVISRAMETHPPSRCVHVKAAAGKPP